MKKCLIIPVLLVLGPLSGMAQSTLDIGFAVTKDTVRKQTESVVYPIRIRTNTVGITGPELLAQYTLSLEVDDDRSSLPRSEYSLSGTSITLDRLPADYTAFLTLKGDTLRTPDRDRVVELQLKLTKRSDPQDAVLTRATQRLTLTVPGVRIVSAYNYLSYIGTNFDLVDNIKPKDLFFAVGIFSAPKQENNKHGFTLTLYGNRTVSNVDSIGQVSFTSRIVPIGGDSARYYDSQALRTVTRVTDNLGASFSPIFDLWKWNPANASTKLYYAPQFELIYRRSNSTTEYKDPVLRDSTDRADRPFGGPIDFPLRRTVPTNIYDVYLGLLGVMVSHENSRISVRVQGSLGYKFSYRADNLNSRTGDRNFTRTGDCFSYVRVWITEPRSGLTFGADISNNLFRNYSPYYNVTLSKAIDLSALGTIFQPLTARPAK